MVEEHEYIRRKRKGQVLLALALLIMSLTVGRWLYRTMKNHRRPQFSLMALLGMVFVSGFAMWGAFLWHEAGTALNLARAAYDYKFGRFVFGGDYSVYEIAHNRVSPLVTVAIRPFLMGKTEVTQGQFEMVMGNNPARSKGGANPVECITVAAASTFCRKLSEKFGISVRLPMGTEWEFACRGGSEGLYYAGDTEEVLSTVAWWGKNSNGMTHPCGMKAPNGYGLYDMLGNVQELCTGNSGKIELHGGATHARSKWP